MRFQCYVTDVWQDVTPLDCSVRQNILSWPCAVCERRHVTNERDVITRAFDDGAFDDRYGSELKDPKRTRQWKAPLDEHYITVWAGRLLKVPDAEIIHRAKFAHRQADV
jgi:hypothetical protein